MSSIVDNLEKTLLDDLEKCLEQIASKNNLSDLQVKSIIKNFFKDENVKNLINKLEQDELSPQIMYNKKSEFKKKIMAFAKNYFFNIQPKITRSKLKEYKEMGVSDSSLWLFTPPPLPPSKIKEPKGLLFDFDENNKLKFGDLEFPDSDENDDDFIPGKNESDLIFDQNNQNLNIFEFDADYYDWLEKIFSDPLNPNNPLYNSDLYDADGIEVPFSENYDKRLLPFNFDHEEENDTDYDFMAELENFEEDPEDLRDDWGVHVTRKELNELLDELFEDDETGNGGVRLTKTHHHHRSITEPHRDCKSSKDHSSPPKPASQGEQESLTLKGISKLIPNYVLTLGERENIKEQMSKHVQMLTQTYLLCTENDSLTPLQDIASSNLRDLDKLGTLFYPEGERSRSLFYSENLGPALKLVDSFIHKGPNKSHTAPTTIPFKTGTLLPLTMEVMHEIATNPLFKHVELLPHVAFKKQCPHINVNKGRSRHLFRHRHKYFNVYKMKLVHYKIPEQVKAEDLNESKKIEKYTKHRPVRSRFLACDEKLLAYGLAKFYEQPENDSSSTTQQPHVTGDSDLQPNYLGLDHGGDYLDLTHFDFDRLRFIQSYIRQPSEQLQKALKTTTTSDPIGRPANLDHALRYIHDHLMPCKSYRALASKLDKEARYLIKGFVEKLKKSVFTPFGSMLADSLDAGGAGKTYPNPLMSLSHFLANEPMTFKFDMTDLIGHLQPSRFIREQPIRAFLLSKGKMPPKNEFSIDFLSFLNFQSSPDFPNFPIESISRTPLQFVGQLHALVSSQASTETMKQLIGRLQIPKWLLYYHLHLLSKDNKVGNHIVNNNFSINEASLIDCSDGVSDITHCNEQSTFIGVSSDGGINDSIEPPLASSNLPLTGSQQTHGIDGIDNGDDGNDPPDTPPSLNNSSVGIITLKHKIQFWIICLARAIKRKYFRLFVRSFKHVGSRRNIIVSSSHFSMSTLVDTLKARQGKAPPYITSSITVPENDRGRNLPFDFDNHLGNSWSYLDLNTCLSDNSLLQTSYQHRSAASSIFRKHLLSSKLYIPEFQEPRILRNRFKKAEQQSGDELNTILNKISTTDGTCVVTTSSSQEEPLEDQNNLNIDELYHASATVGFLPRGLKSLNLRKLNRTRKDLEDTLNILAETEQLKRRSNDTLINERDTGVAENFLSMAKKALPPDKYSDMISIITKHPDISDRESCLKLYGEISQILSERPELLELFGVFLPLNIPFYDASNIKSNPLNESINSSTSSSLMFDRIRKFLFQIDTFMSSPTNNPSHYKRYTKRISEWKLSSGTLKELHEILKAFVKPNTFLTQKLNELFYDGGSAGEIPIEMYKNLDEFEEIDLTINSAHTSYICNQNLFPYTTSSETQTSPLPSTPPTIFSAQPHDFLAPGDSDNEFETFPYIVYPPGMASHLPVPGVGSSTTSTTTPKCRRKSESQSLNESSNNPSANLSSPNCAAISSHVLRVATTKIKHKLRYQNHTRTHKKRIKEKELQSSQESPTLVVVTTKNISTPSCNLKLNSSIAKVPSFHLPSFLAASASSSTIITACDNSDIMTKSKRLKRFNLEQSTFPDIPKITPINVIEEANLITCHQISETLSPDIIASSVVIPDRVWTKDMDKFLLISFRDELRKGASSNSNPTNQIEAISSLSSQFWEEIERELNTKYPHFSDGCANNINARERLRHLINLMN